MLKNIRIVLVNPSHPGNIGAVARAMKNMDLSTLYLVNPKQFPHGQATVMASGADDILQQAKVVSSIQQAVEGCDYIYGTSARVRTLEKSIISPRTCAESLVCQPNTNAAILFGRESAGLTNEELALCHQHIVIPTSESFSSLNLAASVQVIAYEIKAQQALAKQVKHQPSQRDIAPADQVLSFYKHLENTLTAIEFLNPQQPKMLMQRLQRLFNRALLDKTEINILRGILSKIDKKTNNTERDS